jgi:hypothetical protein
MLSLGESTVANQDLFDVLPSIELTPRCCFVSSEFMGSCLCVPYVSRGLVNQVN